MTEAPSDWKVQVVLDQEAIIDDIMRLVQILTRQRTHCIVSAVSEADALRRAEEHLKRIHGISLVYVKAMHPRKLEDA